MEVYAKDLQLGDVLQVISGSAASTSEGVIIDMRTVFLPVNDCILLWTPSMNLVVDNVVSSCNTEGWNDVPRIAKPLAAYFANNFYDQVYDKNSATRRTLRFFGYKC